MEKNENRDRTTGLAVDSPAMQNLVRVATMMLARLDLEPAEAVFPNSALREDLRSALSDVEEAPRKRLKYANVIRSWESDDKDLWNALSEDQRKSWSLEVEEASSNQLELLLWPDGEPRGNATSGLRLLVEIDGGRPAVHIAPSPESDCACRVRQLTENELHVRAGFGSPRRELEDEDEPSYVFGNGC